MSKQTITQPKLNSQRYLNSPRKDCLSLRTKIAIITFSKLTHSLILDKIFLLIEYIQLIAQVLSLFPVLYNGNNFKTNLMLKVIVYPARFFNPGSWIDFMATNAFTNRTIFAVFAVFTILKYSVFLYVILIVKFNSKGNNLVFSLWAYIYRLQAKVLCFFSTSLFFQAIMATSQNDFDYLGIGRMTFVALCIFIITLEYGLSFFLQAIFCYILPSKSFSACKNNLIEVTNLLQKLIFQVLLAILIRSTISNIWILALSNMTLNIVKKGLCFSNLYFYHPEALFYEVSLSATVLSLNISWFVSILMESVEYENRMSFILITWVILAIMLIKLSYEYLKMILLNTITANSGSANYLVHKLSILKYFKKNGKKHFFQTLKKKNEYFDLINSFINTSAKSIFQINNSMIPIKNILDINSKENLNELYISYLESLAARFPKNDFIKLYIAYICIHKLENFSVAIKTIQTTKQSFSKKIALNASILIYEIQKQLTTQSNHENNPLNLSEYTEALTKVAKIKTKMSQQAENQSQILREVLSETPNLTTIFNLSQLIDTQITNLQRKIKKVIEIIPDAYTEPFLIFAYYSLVLNHSASDYLNYSKKYSQKCKKYEKFLKHDCLVKENLFQNTNGLVAISAQKNDLGKIIFCSQSIERIYGNYANTYIGTQVSSLAPPCLQSFYASYYKALAEKGEKLLIRNVTRSFAYQINGYISLVDFYADFHPYVTQNFCFNMIVRPVPTWKDYMLLLENGDIDCASEKISKKLALLSSLSRINLVNISSISEELSIANHAFNIIASSEKQQSNKENNYNGLYEEVENYLSDEKTKKIYSLYSNKGANIKLIPINARSAINVLSYHCIIQNQFYGSTLVKVVTLDEMTEDDELDVHIEEDVEKKFDTELITQPNAITRKQITRNKESKVEEELNGFISSEEKPSSLHEFKTFQNNRNSKNLCTERNPEKKLIFPTENFATTEMLLSEPKISVRQKRSLFMPDKQVSNLQKAYKAPNKVAGNELNYEKSFKIEKSAASGDRLSKLDLHLKFSSSFKAALAVKYSPRSLKVLYLLFYVFLFLIFAGQMNLKGILDHAIEYMKTSKDIVYNAEMRIFLLANIQQTSRLIWDMGFGTLKFNSAFLYGDYHLFIYILHQFITELRNTNQDLLKSMDSLEEETRRILFMKDVKIYDTYYDEPAQVFETLNNFQASNKIIEIGLEGINMIMQNNITRLKSKLQFLARNSLNDLLIKNELTSNILMESVNSKQSNISTTVDIYLISSVSLLSISTIALIWAAWSQFKTEKFNMIALVKLNPRSIKNTLDRIDEFKIALDSETVFEENQNLELKKATENFFSNKFSKDNMKNDSVKRPNSYGTSKKYWVHVLCLLFFLCALVGLMTGYSIWNNNSLKFFQKIQSQFFFINRLKSQLSLVASMPQELLGGNGTTLTHNRPNSQEFPKAISIFNLIKNDLEKTLMNEDRTYDPQIEDLLFHDGCSYIIEEWSFFCLILKSGGKKTGLVYLLSSIQTVLQETSENFIMSNKSSESLMALSGQTLDSLIFSYFVAFAECDAVSLMIGQILEFEILRTLGVRNLMYAMFVIIFVILSGIIWIFVICPLKEANNRFKKVLGTFPADLIFSSFLLKSFVMKTSDDALNSVKNYL